MELVGHTDAPGASGVVTDLLNLRGLSAGQALLEPARREALRAEQQTRVQAWLTAMEPRGFLRVSADLREVIQLCLEVDPQERPSPEQLLHLHPYFQSASPPTAMRWAVAPALKCVELAASLDATVRSVRENAAPADVTPNEDPLAGKPLADIYHLWRLAGGELELELSGSLQVAPAVTRIPAWVPVDSSANQGGRAIAADTALLYDERIIGVSLAHLRQYLLEHDTQSGTPPGSEGLARSRAAKHKDVTYQRERIEAFRELLSALPGSERQLIEQARRDIPAVLRDQIWAVLLGLHGKDVQTMYDAIDKESEGASDHQIDVDIPRCHQYHELLSSSEGHRKLKRVLKAWVEFNKGSLVYWQGLDSLLAPLLALNFNNEALAFACLQKLVTTHVRDFFLADNSSYMQEHLLIFRHVIAFHDPELAVHLHSAGFHPDLFAIPWFLTLFSHILPLEKVYPLWDAILASSPNFSLFIALAILVELRTTLLPLDFNACILFFSHLPEFDIPECIQSARRFYHCTPPSVIAKKSKQPVATNAERYWEEHTAFEVFSAELAPRIALGDVLTTQPPLLLLDVRKAKDFEAGHLAGSVNLNHKDPSLTQLEPHRGAPIVVIADRGKQGPEFASLLVRNRFPQVSVLNGGIDVVRQDAAALITTQ